MVSKTVLKIGANVTFSAMMQFAGGPKPVAMEGEIADLDDIQNGRVKILVDGLPRDIAAANIEGYDRERNVGPILFSEDMVRSLRAKRKTVTRQLATSPLRNKYLSLMHI